MDVRARLKNYRVSAAEGATPGRTRFAARESRRPSRFSTCRRKRFARPLAKLVRSAVGERRRITTTATRRASTSTTSSSSDDHGGPGGEHVADSSSRPGARQHGSSTEDESHSKSCSQSTRRRLTVGQKVHPYGFRLGTLFGWQSNWFAERRYGDAASRRPSHVRELHQEEAVSRRHFQGGDRPNR